MHSGLPEAYEVEPGKYQRLQVPSKAWGISRQCTSSISSLIFFLTTEVLSHSLTSEMLLCRLESKSTLVGYPSDLYFFHLYASQTYSLLLGLVSILNK